MSYKHCTCDCHTPGHNSLEYMPCCELSGKKFISEEGEVCETTREDMYKKLQLYLKGDYKALKRLKKPRHKKTT